MTPAGYMTPREALNLLGKARFGAEWTGKESSAPLVPPPVPSVEYLRAVAAAAASASGAPAVKMVVTRSAGLSITSTRDAGRLVAVSPPPPPPPSDATLKAQSEDAQREHDAISALIERRNSIAEELRKACEAPDIPSAFVDPATGLLLPMEPRHWRSDACRERFVSDRMGWPEQGYRRDYLVFLAKTEVQALADSVLSGNTSDRLVPAVQQQTTQAAKTAPVRAPMSFRKWALFRENRVRAAQECGQRWSAADCDKEAVAEAMIRIWERNNWKVTAKFSAVRGYLYEDDVV